jgi:predicted CXXCH cytochrome family protein
MHFLLSRPSTTEAVSEHCRADASQTFRAAIGLGLFLVGVIGLGLIGGCSSPPGDGAVQDSRPASPWPLHAHPGACSDCHAAFDRHHVPTSAPSPSSCTTPSCHASLVDPGAIAHAPVILGDCGACHVPHASREPDLLLAAPAPLCGSCHGQLFSCPSTRASNAASCTSCHDPHGGASRHFLRPSPSPAALTLRELSRR